MIYLLIETIHGFDMGSRSTTVIKGYTTDKDVADKFKALESNCSNNTVKQVEKYN
jgi:hypothetical protein